MKVSKEKKSKIKLIIEWACNYINHKAIANKIWYLHNKELFLTDLLDRIITVLENIANRSLPEHRYYWGLITWVAGNIPEHLEKALDIVNKDVKYKKDVIHALVKTKFEVSSIKFDKFGGDEMHELTQKTKLWLAHFFYHTDTYKLDQMINETVDDMKRS